MGMFLYSKIAKKISPYINLDDFAEYIDQVSSEAIMSICERFLEYLPEIDLYNASSHIAELFRDLIKKAASEKRKSTTNGAKVSGVVDNENQSSVAKEDSEHTSNDESSGETKGDTKTTVIHQQINILQNGENNYNLTNNGTITFDLKGVRA